MQRTHIKDLKDHIGEDVVVAGFVEALRNQGKIAFILLRDITGVIQLVSIKSDNAEVFKRLDNLSLESVVKVEGHVKEEKQAPGGFEVALNNFEVLSHADPELPIPVVVEKGGEESDMYTRLDWRWIDLRKQKINNI